MGVGLLLKIMVLTSKHGPSPNYLGTGTVLDEEAFRAHIRKSLKAAKGCEMEITQRDVYTINRDIPKAKKYVDIIKEEIVNCW